MISDISLGTWLTISFPLFMYTAIVTVSFLDRYTKYLSLAAWYRRWCWSLCWKQRQERDGGQRNCTRVLLACSYVSKSWFCHVPDSYTNRSYYLRTAFILLRASRSCGYHSRVATIWGRHLFKKYSIRPEFDDVMWLSRWNKFRDLHVDWQDILKHHKTLWNTVRH